jgi:hypothetical protein
LDPPFLEILAIFPRIEGQIDYLNVDGTMSCIDSSKINAFNAVGRGTELGMGLIHTCRIDDCSKVCL